MGKGFKMLAAAAAFAIGATAAHAVTIVQYRQVTSSPTVQLTNMGNNYSFSSIGSPIVRVTLFNPDDFNDQLVVDARLQFAANGSGAATVNGGNVVQQVLDGSFSLTAVNAFSFGGFTGTNILSGNFGDGVLQGTLQTRNPTVSVSLPVSTLFNVQSDFFFKADDYQLDNFSITTSGANPALTLQNGRLANFNASSVGTFDAELAVVPEPATWAMMIAGFGMVGFAARRRRVARTAA